MIFIKFGFVYKINNSIVIGKIIGHCFNLLLNLRGIGTIFKAKKIIIMASDASKKDAVKAMLERVVNTKFPATLLNLHPDVTLICTADAFD